MKFPFYKLIPALAISVVGLFSSCGSSSGDDDDDYDYSEWEQTDDRDGQSISGDDESTRYGGRHAGDSRGRSNSKPTTTSIPYDLIGRSVNEGGKNGYFDYNWSYNIEDGDVEGVTVEDILEDDDNQYTAVMRLKLRGTSSTNEDSSRSNYYFSAKVKIRYVNDSREGWVLDYVNSLGLSVVSDGAYDDNIWMANDNVRTITNNADIPLTVGGRYLKDNRWGKFMQLVPAHSESAPLCDGYFSKYVDDAIIDFVIR
ncbi:MAG: hypothetical protein J1E63_00225 [Muribaculaceae bacterium]|nr:hypothetical protein [Muribaculaceae bacterium]